MPKLADQRVVDGGRRTWNDQSASALRYVVCRERLYPEARRVDHHLDLPWHETHLIA
jgi:hypothetical protein